MTYESDGAGLVMSGIADEAGRARALKQAREHTRRVRRLRRILPIAGAVLVALALLSNLSLFKGYGPVSVGRITLQDGALKMENPHLSGFTDDNRAYELGAASATQDAFNPQTVRLSGVTAHIKEPDGKSVSLSADKGIFHTGEEVLKLMQNIVVRTERDYELRLEAARVEMKSGMIVSETPVELDFLTGKLTAERLQVENRGEKVLFLGNVRLGFRPNGEGVIRGTQ